MDKVYNIEEELKEVAVSDSEMELFTSSYTGYICDAIMEISDGATSIYYADIIEYLKDHVEEVNEIISEFGWDGVGQDIYKATQYAQQREIENNFNIEDAVRYYVYSSLLQEGIVELTEDQFDEIDSIITGADNNDRLGCIMDEVLEIVTEEDEDEEEGEED